jgi:hypothetical protein|tara:strand:+ start:259 stop:405 length:147 start_codon:yes stop_codon:yes gene_type:complete
MGMKNYAKSSIAPRFATRAQMEINRAGARVADMEKMKKGGEKKSKKKK